MWIFIKIVKAPWAVELEQKQKDEFCFLAQNGPRTIRGTPFWIEDISRSC